MTVVSVPADLKELYEAARAKTVRVVKHDGQMLIYAPDVVLTSLIERIGWVEEENSRLRGLLHEQPE